MKPIEHVSEAEAVRDFATLLKRVHGGAEIIIESDTSPIVVVRAAEPPRRTVSECIALDEAYEKQTGKSPALDPDFAEDVEKIIAERKPWNPPAWD